MLDMAFQLLAFFILTFKPSAVESQIMMRLPNDKPVTQAPSNQVSATDVVDEGLVVPISIYSTPDGDIEKLEIGQRVSQRRPSKSCCPRSERHWLILSSLGATRLVFVWLKICVTKG